MIKIILAFNLLNLVFSQQKHGLTVNTYTNLVSSGNPTSTSFQDSLSSISFSCDGPCSVEAVWKLIFLHQWSTYILHNCHFYGCLVWNVDSRTWNRLCVSVNVFFAKF